MIIVTVSRSGEKPTTHQFDGDKVRIGREPDNDVVLDSPACSRYHAEIALEGGIYKIVDLGSTNGIVIADKRVSEYLLSEGLSLTIGEHELGFSIPASESPKTVAIPIGGAPEPEPPPVSKVLYLHIRGRGKERGVKVVMGADYVVGRSAGADVVVEDDSCSSRHAVVYWKDDRAMIRDLESANGTTVNGERIVDSEIRAGDRINLGRTEIVISDRPLDTVDDDVLLKRTRLGMPAPAASEEEERPAETIGPDPAPIPRRVMVTAAAVILMIVVAAVGWRIIDRLLPESDRTEDPSATAAEVTVQVRPVVQKELSFTFSAAGTINPQRQVTVSAEIPGRVVSVPAQSGSMVTSGQELIRLDDREIRLQITEASSSITREQVEVARQDYERKQRLFDDGAVTRSVLDQSKNHYLGLDSAYRSAQARIAQLRERATKARITSPLTGTVARLEVEPGEFVGPGTPVAVIEDMEEVLVMVEVADREVVRLRPLQVVEATSDAFPGRIFSGVIERVGSTANPVTRAFEVEARIANPEGELRSGMIISLRIVLDKRSTLVVPAEALLETRGGTARVFVVSDGVAHSLEVNIGRRSDRDVELVSGLQEGDEVIVAGHDRVKDGQPVTTYRAD
jgi:membrane fusion protein (multidrug efflux system)